MYAQGSILKEAVRQCLCDVRMQGGWFKTPFPESGWGQWPLRPGSPRAGLPSEVVAAMSFLQRPGPGEGWRVTHKGQRGRSPPALSCLVCRLKAQPGLVRAAPLCSLDLIFTANSSCAENFPSTFLCFPV